MKPKDTHLTHLDLFSGIGMFALAARWAGIETVAFSEVEPYANRVLDARFPEVRNLGDIRKLCRRIADCDTTNYDTEGTAWCPRCDSEFGDCACVGSDEFTDTYGFPDVITAGFPCQDVSVGSHTGTGIDGARSGLWSEALRVAGELGPRFLLIENVPALKTRGFEAIVEQLAEAGYAAEAFVVGANHVGGHQRRKRVWIAAYHSAQRIQGMRAEGQQVAHALAQSFIPLRDGDGQWQVEPDLRRSNDGDSHWMDRLACIGNSIVPQIPVHFFDWMRDVTKAERAVIGQ
jgi:DNA (cytosine-5)-methyltransferase 1